MMKREGYLHMLKEIYSTAFKTFNGKVRDRIVLNPGLNVVLGTNDGANSIGKSSFLMVVDFALGGDDYIDKCSDIQDNVKAHTICFAFEINGEMKYFSRSTINRGQVSICDSNYNSIETISISKYRKFLADNYETGGDYQSFRGMVSTYFRIYQRENLDEKHPIEVARKGKVVEAIDELIKLFGRFDTIKELRNEKAKADEIKNTISKSIKHEIATKISDSQFEKNLVRIEELQTELNRLSDMNSEKRLEVLGIDKDITEEINNARQKVIDSRRIYSRIRSEYRAICNSKTGEFASFDEDINLLREFFPEVNVRKIKEIEDFHRSMERIINSEIEEESKKIATLLEEAKESKEKAEAELNELTKQSLIGERIIDRVAKIRAELDILERNNSVHKKEKSAKERINSFHEDSVKVVCRQLTEIERDLNVEMDNLNKSIYKNGRKAPIINFNDSGDGYTFMVPNDSGTGTSCRGLILFDLSVLKLTNLPILIHDSVIHKQIEDFAFNKLLDLYEESGKQIFIAMDKQNSFGEEVEKKLEKAAVLHLSKGGNELYGAPWYE